MNQTAVEFSHVISVARLSPNGIIVALEAKPAEREALARRFGLVELGLLKADLHVQPGSDRMITVTGKVTAQVTQNCVVTLENLRSRIDSDIDLICMPEEMAKKAPDNGDDADADIEFYCDGKIDLGEIAAQHLGIAIDPYPRKPDANLTATEFGAGAVKKNPFAALVGSVKTTE